MALTRIDCRIYRGEKISSEKALYAVLNPRRQPGSLVAAGAVAARDNLGGQVGCRLALEHFVEAMLDGASDATREKRTAAEAEDLCVTILEGAFRRANTSVYEFGHKLAAGGRMAASLVGFYVTDGLIAAGRAGGVSAYLFRGPEVCPFFSEAPDGEKNTGFVGENSVLTVELSSIELQPHDLIVALPTILDADQQVRLREYVCQEDLMAAGELEGLVEMLYSDPELVAFALQAQVGPEVIYLKQVVTDNKSGAMVKAHGR